MGCGGKNKNKPDQGSGELPHVQGQHYSTETSWLVDSTIQKIEPKNQIGGRNAAGAADAAGAAGARSAGAARRSDAARAARVCQNKIQR